MRIKVATMRYNKKEYAPYTPPKPIRLRVAPALFDALLAGVCDVVVEPQRALSRVPADKFYFSGRKVEVVECGGRGGLREGYGFVRAVYHTTSGSLPAFQYDAYCTAYGAVHERMKYTGMRGGTYDATPSLITAIWLKSFYQIQ